MDQLQNIYGIGPTNAKKIAELIDLQKDIREQLRNPDIFSTLPVATQADLTHNPIRDIPRELIDIINSEFHRLVKVKFDIAGSYRRGKAISHDVDIVVKGNRETVDNLIRNINKNSKVVFFHTPYAGGDHKINLMAAINVVNSNNSISRNKVSSVVKLDIFMAQNNYMFLLLFATGSGKFNIRMRYTAKRKGYLLNQYGLYKGGQKIIVKTEKNLFDILGMHYLTPEERVG